MGDEEAALVMSTTYDEARIGVRIKISALWVSLLFLYA
jgi:hypothetical protein